MYSKKNGYISILFFLLIPSFIANIQADEKGSSGYENANHTENVLYLYHSPALDKNTFEGFSLELASSIRSLLENIGYELRLTGDINDVSGFSAGRLLHISTAESNDSTGSNIRIIVSLIEPPPFNLNNLEYSLNNPLVSLPFNRNEKKVLVTVLAKKIFENIRNSLICHLTIISNPENVYIKRQDSHLEGVTPLEWIIPPDTVKLTGSKDGYLPYEKNIEATSPGKHNVYIELSKKRFYHSGFFYPFVLFGAASAASYLFEQYYYDKYQNLNKNDYENNPEKFNENFTIAKNFERSTLICLGLASVSLTLSFWW